VNRTSTEEVLNKAYRLAYFLHQDKAVAIRIVGAATLKLNVAMAVQSKRLSYIPVGRFSRGESRRTDGIRSKALFSDLHLLQRLIYGESEPYERQKELAAQPAQPGVLADGDPATEEDLLVYFVKHLVRITTKRNAFYVTLGVSRLLHSYSTLETMEIYNAVIGEPERVKDDYYYRSRKAVLMHEMYQRFGELIRACRQRRGEERFETQEGSTEQRSLVRECLRLFTPWDTQCPVPRDFDPLKTVIARLTSKSGDDENRIEVNRIHAVLHPDCFRILIAAFGYTPPEERMELPRFFSHQNDDQSPPRPRNAPTELSAEELAEINQVLAEQSGRRRRASPTAVIRIRVDGVERATLNPAEQSTISFSAEDDAELIEVKTMDQSGDLLLATHLLTAAGEDTPDATIVSSIRLEGGQELSLRITRQRIEATGAGDLRVTFGYRETHPGRAARLWWQRISRRFGSEQMGVRITAGPILVAGIVLVCVAGYLGYVTLRSRVTSGPAETSVAQTSPVQTSVTQTTPQLPQINPATAAAPPAGVNDKPSGRETSTPQPAQRFPSDRSTAAKAPSIRAPVPPQTSDDETAADLTRSGSVIPNLKLNEIKKVYVEMLGGAAFDELRRKLVQNLGSSGVVTATTNADDADAALKVAVSQRSAVDTRGGQQIEVAARLVNARGVVLWPKAGRGTQRYSGETTKVLSDIVKDLIGEIRTARP
jgi:hypothetical protein